MIIEAGNDGNEVCHTSRCDSHIGRGSQVILYNVHVGKYQTHQSKFQLFLKINCIEIMTFCLRLKVVIAINTSKPAVSLCTTIFITPQIHVLPTQCIYVFYVDLRTNSDYSPIQH